jgi:ubiquinone/menaquinone biosynthesis C-methylase UbiE
MLTTQMVHILCCPVCRRNKLQTEIKIKEKDKILEGNLICDACDISYSVHSGIPELIPHQFTNTSEWHMWRNHLEGFQRRREKRTKNTSSIQHSSWKKMHRAFVSFTGISAGNVLDVGCGSGKLRSHLNENNVSYCGLDPLPTEETKNFQYVRAFAEYIPFQDSTFSHVTVVSSLDHFNDLNSFLQEAIRVLKQEGRLYILQSFHGMRGMGIGLKTIAHLVKDRIDDGVTKLNNPKTPKHMKEFTEKSLLEDTNKYFEIDEKKEFSAAWYSPSQLFISMRPIR